MSFSLNDSVLRRRARHGLFVWSMATFVGVLLLWWLEIHFAENTSASALALYLPQHFYLLVPVILLIWALVRRQFSLAGLNALTCLFCLLVPLGWRWSWPRTTNVQTMRVVTFNVQRGEGDLEEVERTLKELRPDVICLQETGRTNALAQNGVGHDIARQFPAWNVRFAGDVTTLSRFSVVADRFYPLPGTRRTLETVLQTPQGKVCVLNTHVSTSFRGDRMPKSRLDRLAVLWETARPSAQVRLAQLPMLQNAVDASPQQIPVVLAGDFNAPPRGLFYNGLHNELRDAFVDAGRGTGCSFPSSFPLLRIDYVWTRGTKARNAFVGGPSGSDHRPLVTDLEVAP